MAPPTQWTWVWVNSGSWWWTGRPGMLQFMGSQSWTRLSDWTELINSLKSLLTEIDPRIYIEYMNFPIDIFKKSNSTYLSQKEEFSFTSELHQTCKTIILIPWKLLQRVKRKNFSICFMRSYNLDTINLMSKIIGKYYSWT